MSELLRDSVTEGLGKVHFVGIGGIGMSGIAQVLLNMGVHITGSDISENENVKRLKDLGIEITIGHKASNVRDADIVVYSSAVSEDNVELAEARRKRKLIVPRAEMLQELMRYKYSVAIAGTHGKTTTSSLIGHILKDANLDPTIVVGGILRSMGSGAQLGKGNYIVIEADESDKSFLHLMPSVIIITTIDEDHLDNYEGIKEIKNIFTQFANRIPLHGRVILCIDDKNIQDIVPHIKRRVITYGLSKQADIRADNIVFEKDWTVFDLIIEGKKKETIKLLLPGEHNVYNTLAAIALGNILNIPDKIMANSISSFSGVGRRFEIIYKKDGIWIVDDYAHHPREIEVTLSAARQKFDGKIISIFQPHLYSRTLNLKDRFAKAFYEADEVIFTDIYPAREKPRKDVSGKILYDLAIKYGHTNVKYTPTQKDLIKYLVKVDRDIPTMFLFMGAGSISKWAKEFKELL